MKKTKFYQDIVQIAFSAEGVGCAKIAKIVYKIRLGVTVNSVNFV